jgi:hypothetical protein
MPPIGALTLGDVGGPGDLELGEGVGFRSTLAATDLLTKDSIFRASCADGQPF